MSEAHSVSLSELTVRRERHLFAWLAVSIAILVFGGFARTYYLQSLFKTPKLSTFLHVHGAVMTGWVVLFAVQTLLITSRHIRMHRILGAFGAGYAVVVVVMGCTATVLAARREVLAQSQFVSGFLTVLALELTQMFLFAFLVASGIWLRNRGGYHKRLMVLATFCILPNPIVRVFMWAGFGNNIVILSVWSLLIVTVVALDSMRNRKFHPAFAFAAPTTIGCLTFAYFASLSSVWQHFAADAVRLGT